MLFRRHDPVVDRLAALGLSVDAATRLAGAGTLLDLPAGTTLCTEGERGLQAFLLLDGTATVHLGRREVILKAGEVIGEQATLDGRRSRNATVTAASPVTVLVFDLATFRSLAEAQDLHARLVPERAAA
jgi:CRP-like cAMP-binding protein